MFALVDVTRLTVFREVVTRGSFTAAAAALRISQPAVSAHVAKLEQEIGTTLVVRSGRGLQLTPPGEVLLRRTDELLAHLRDTSDELAAMAGGEGGELRVVTFPSAAATIVPPVVGAFRRHSPQASVAMREADPPDALPALLAGRFDVALAYDYPVLATPRDPRLHWQVVAEDRMAVALPVGHPMTRADQVPLATLSDERWVAPHASVCREALDLACRRAGFTPGVVSETNDYMAMLGLVAAEVGIAVVPRLVAAIAVPAGVVLRPLTPNPLYRTIAAVTRPAGYRPPILDTMVRLLATMTIELAHPDLPLLLPPGAPAVRPAHGRPSLDPHAPRSPRRQPVTARSVEHAGDRTGRAGVPVIPLTS